MLSFLRRISFFVILSAVTSLLAGSGALAVDTSVPGGGLQGLPDGPGRSVFSAGPIVLVSRSSGGTIANNVSHSPWIAPDGRWVAFDSDATNLAPGDSGLYWDIFVHDLETGETTLISKGYLGDEANQRSKSASVSPDGRYVVYDSLASNLVPGDLGGHYDVFIYDRQNDTTTLVSVDSSSTQGDDNSQYPAMSTDGRYVAFQSDAGNLVGGDSNGETDVFVRDLQTNTTTRVSVSSLGAEGNDISEHGVMSSDGRYVAFPSAATNLVSGDTNGKDDIFLHDRDTGQTTRVSVSSGGAQGDNDSSTPKISSDGRYVCFTSYATNLVPGDTNAQLDAFVHDRNTATTTRVSVDSSGIQGNASSYCSGISADGRFVSMVSGASNLVGGDTNLTYDIFVHDRETGETVRVSTAADGTEGNDLSTGGVITDDGRYVSFGSAASNLVAGDTNGFDDAFVYDRSSDFTLDKTVDCDTPTVGDDVVFRLELSNQGPHDASGLVVSDSLPAGLTYVLHSASQGSYNHATGDWNVGALAVGQSATLDITATVTVTGTITNTAQLTASTPEIFDEVKDQVVIQAVAQASEEQYLLTVEVRPGGGGTVTGMGIDCPGDCTEYFDQGAQVTLTAVATGENVFRRLDRGCLPGG